MTSYSLPVPAEPPTAAPMTVYTVASGDLRLSANVTGWPTQEQLEADLTAAVNALGWQVQRGHPFSLEKGHGFIDSQRAGIEVFKAIPRDAPLIVVEAVWQYSHHVLAGLRSHRGPILIVANWSGEFPDWWACSTSRAASPRRGCRTRCCGARTSPTSGRAKG